MGRCVNASFRALCGWVFCEEGWIQRFGGVCQGGRLVNAAF